MNAGYVRLSKDDDKKNYSSIENQKLIILQYAVKHHITIDRWYEDDGFSGYLFDRPAFKQLMEDLKNEIHTVYIKDFSRLGRHNARVLLLLDELKEQGKRLVSIDDHYDSLIPEDDMIGLKTWFNERYIKDTSKKIKRSLHAKQKEGSLITRPPFGYRKAEGKNGNFMIDETESHYIKLIFELYLSGLGYRKVAQYLSEHHIPTPSACQHKKNVKNGHISGRVPALQWSDSMVKEILNNDFYIGTLRLKKRERTLIHGKDHRVPKGQQYVFSHHHPPIIDPAVFSLVQQTKEQRSRTHYRGIGHSNKNAQSPALFQNYLYCKDCKSRMTPIRRQTSTGERLYYVCSGYNSKGKHFCAKSHLITEKDLKQDILAYLVFCRNHSDLKENTVPICDKRPQQTEKMEWLSTSIQEKKQELKILTAQKTKDLSISPEYASLIHETYRSLQHDLLMQIQNLNLQLKQVQTKHMCSQKNTMCKEDFSKHLDHIIQTELLQPDDLPLLIECIFVDQYGFPEIKFQCHFYQKIFLDAQKQMNKKTAVFTALILVLIKQEHRHFTSFSYLLNQLNTLGIKKKKSDLIPYLNLIEKWHIIKKTDQTPKPYWILQSDQEIHDIIEMILPEISPPFHAELLSHYYLHGAKTNRWYAGDDL